MRHNRKCKITQRSLNKNLIQQIRRAQLPFQETTPTPTWQGETLCRTAQSSSAVSPLQYSNSISKVFLSMKWLKYAMMLLCCRIDRILISFMTSLRSLSERQFRSTSFHTTRELSCGGKRRREGLISSS